MIDGASFDYAKRVGHVPHNPVCKAKGHDLPEDETGYHQFAPGCFKVTCNRCLQSYAVLNTGMVPWNDMFDIAAESFANIKPLKEASDPRFQRVSTELRPKFDIEMPDEVAKCGPWDAKKV